MTAVTIEIWRFRATKRPGTCVLVAREGSLVGVDGNELAGLSGGVATDLPPDLSLVSDLQVLGLGLGLIR